ncbi:sigma factor-like helix-turn-helix DNA-binding protein [Acidobacterium sp. S8]|uniref:sigma factor-like helix-turn-helix DNA-binding protein n=1 Tax=Acidobacterium sp. S8 TaxID=1641854 RepID=UPI00131E1576|nr:sigma factor-like helix-turn-helix DNA-binding protein [Acidobacterium sp. S8]
MAFLVLLESLSAIERAVFLLRQVFDYDYAEIAPIVGKREENCRQIFVRAKRHISAGKPRFNPSSRDKAVLAERFFAACNAGSEAELMSILAQDAVFFGDGGGKVSAVTRPVLGAGRVSRLLLGLFAQARKAEAKFERAEVNGQPGAMFFDATHRLISVLGLEIQDRKIVAVQVVINPEKLSHLGPLSHLPQSKSPPPIA